MFYSCCKQRDVASTKISSGWLDLQITVKQLVYSQVLFTILKTQTPHSPHAHHRNRFLYVVQTDPRPTRMYCMCITPPFALNREPKHQPSVHPTCRKIFWVAAAFGWAVWVLAVAAAGDEHWGELPTGDTYGVGTGFVEDACDGGGASDAFCTARE